MVKNPYCGAFPFCCKTSPFVDSFVSTCVLQQLPKKLSTHPSCRSEKGCFGEQHKVSTPMTRCETQVSLSKSKRNTKRKENSSGTLQKGYGAVDSGGAGKTSKEQNNHGRETETRAQKDGYLLSQKNRRMGGKGLKSSREKWGRTAFSAKYWNSFERSVWEKGRVGERSANAV